MSGESSGRRRMSPTRFRPGVVWIRDGWFWLNHLTSGDAVLTGDALSLFSFSVRQSDYGAPWSRLLAAKGIGQSPQPAGMTLIRRQGAKNLTLRRKTRFRQATGLRSVAEGERDHKRPLIKTLIFV